MFASRSNRGFFDPEINDFMPDDVVEISPERHAELLAGQCEGKIIAWGDDGFPMLIDAPPPSVHELADTERAWRDAQLSPTDAIVSRHRDEVESGGETTFTDEQYTELLVYRRGLRDWPQMADFPLADHRPAVPALLLGKIQ